MEACDSGVLLARAILAAALALAQHYDETDLTADTRPVSQTAANIDSNLVNAWGLARGTNTFWWISDNGTGLTTLYDGGGVPQSLVVTIPSPNGNGPSAPTGAVFNYSTTSFAVKGTPSVFLFVTEDGTIAGWNPAAGKTAVLAVNHSGDAAYKGCAIADTRQGPRLFATNFTTGKVEAYDENFNQVAVNTSAFQLPSMPSGFVPFNIQNVGGNLVVTFAFRQGGSEDEQHGPGLGFVGVFSPSGRLLRQLQGGMALNAPWGVVLAPSDFGAFSHRLLIGNFGDGTIHAFNLFTGELEGTLLGTNDQPLQIDGLWALGFGNGGRAGAAQALFFTAGQRERRSLRKTHAGGKRTARDNRIECSLQPPMLAPSGVPRRSGS